MEYVTLGSKGAKALLCTEVEADRLLCGFTPLSHCSQECQIFSGIQTVV